MSDYSIRKKDSFEVNTENIFNHQIRVIHDKGVPARLESYRKARAEILKKMYEEMEPEYHRVCTFKHPTDGRKDKHELYEVEEGISPFDDPELEEKMPDFEDFLK